MTTYPRHTARTARFMLAWLLLLLTAGVVSPLVQPRAFELVCSGTGLMKLVAPGDEVSGDAGGTAHAQLTLDCPACLYLGLPGTPATPVLRAAPAPELTPARVTTPLLAKAPGALPPPRGPPLS